MALLMSKKLKYFIVCFETRCINHAADQLCVTRSPLTRVMYELEEKAGGKLFVRKYNHLEPTELAFNLYEKIKPVYDLLCAIESEFGISANLTRFELLCDISVPFVIYQHISSLLSKSNCSISCRRVSVSCNEIQSLKTNPDVGIISFREIALTENFVFHKVSEEVLFLLMPEGIHEKSLKDFESIKDIKLLIRKDVFSPELKGIIAKSIRDFAPYIDIRETDRDTTSMLISVCAGEGMMLLPECLSSYFSPPGTCKIKVPNVRIKTGLYVNKRQKNKTIISSITDMLMSITK